MLDKELILNLENDFKNLSENFTKENFKDLSKNFNKLLHNYKKKSKRLDMIIKQSDAQSAELIKLNDSLDNAAHKDPMTGAYNRRYFFKHAEDMMDNSKLANNSFSLAMIDIDKFKNINDTHGHDIGDKVIISLVNKALEFSKHFNIFSRFGGEEFIILFDNEPLDEVHSVLENIRSTIENASDINDIKFTISIGLSQTLDTDTTINHVIKRADLGLYEAKETGRNKVCIYKEPQ